MNGFWIFLVIVVLQAVIGAIAKSAEKRKKQEAARLKLEASSSTPPRGAPADRPSPPTAVSTTAPSGPRQLGLMIREAMGTAGPATGQTTRSAGKTREELLAERQRRIDALRRRQAQAAGRSEPPPPSRKPPAPPVVRAEPVVAASAAPPAAPPRPTSPSAPATPVQRASTSRRTTSTATNRIRRLLRQPASVRDAILVAEILREPVALRRQPPGPTA